MAGSSPAMVSQQGIQNNHGFTAWIPFLRTEATAPMLAGNDRNGRGMLAADGNAMGVVKATVKLQL
jgi:hypothetical protein